jgi:hypothetical protein
MTDSEKAFEEFEELWAASLARAGRTLTWNDLTLDDQKNLSSKFRKAMDRYGGEVPTGDRTRSGAFASRRNSKNPS